MDTPSSSPVLKQMGEVLSIIVQMAQEKKAPHNVCWTNNNSPLKSHNDAPKRQSTNVDVYVFFRKAESTTTVNTGEIFRLGASEMLGVFHSSSKEQLDSLSNTMDNILSDVSWGPRETVWKEVCKALEIYMER